MIDRVAERGSDSPLQVGDLIVRQSPAAFAEVVEVDGLTVHALHHGERIEIAGAALACWHLEVAAFA